MLLALSIALAVVVLLGAGVGLVLLDRLCVAEAERRVGEQLAVPFGRPPTVAVAGRPFLTQALRGRYADVRVSGGGLRLGEITGVGLDARLRNVYVPLRLLLRSRVAEVPCERVEGTLVLPYGELARATRVPGLELRPSRGRVLATAVLPIPGVGQLVRVTGHAVLTHGDGAVWLRVRGLSVAGISLPSVVLNQLLPALEVPVPLPQLPWGLRIDELQPTDDGLVVLGSADAVVFRRPPEPRPSPRDDRPAR